MAGLKRLRASRNKRFIDNVDYKGLIDARYFHRLTGHRLEADQDAARAYLSRELNEPPASLYFDHHHYLSENPDVFASELHALTHYVLQGRTEGRFPFDPYRTGVQPQLKYAAKRPIAICVPVFGAAKETVRCLESVMAAGGYDRLVVCDDGNDDRALISQLHAWRDEGLLEVVDHAGRNLGFTRSANLLLEVTSECDVIMLNSDTEVFGRWIAGMQAAAYAGRRVASVTALSNNATIASWPLWPSGGPVAPEECARIAEKLDQIAPDAYPLLPTCVGFCVYMRRDAVMDVGTFDAEGFPRGYGEENDWSLRAQQAGWVHVLATNVYVRHAGARSFLVDKHVNATHGSAELLRRYPSYDAGIARWMSTSPLHGWLPATANLLPALAPPTVRLIHVTHSFGGGTDVAIQRFAAASPGTHLILRLGPSRVRVSVLEVRGASVEVAHDLAFDELGPAEWGDVLAGSPDADIWLHDAHSVPQWVLTVLLNQRRPWSVFVHDLGAICSRRFCVLPSGVPCLGPEPDRCTRCVSLDPSPHNGPSDWRMLPTGAVLRQAERVAAPSVHAAERLADSLGLPISVFPLDGSKHVETSVTPNHSQTVLGIPPTARVAIIGTMVPHKGSRFLAPLIEWSFVHAPHIIFRLVGEWQDPLIEKPWSLASTGPYSGTDDLMEELKSFQPHVILFVSAAAETYSLTLDEAFLYCQSAPARILVPEGSVFQARGQGRVQTYSRHTNFPDLLSLIAGEPAK